MRLFSPCTLKKYWLLFGVSVAAGLLLAFAAYNLGRILRPQLHLNGAELLPPVPAVGFSLPGAGGQRVSLQALRGELVLLYFGYTRCPQDCPTMLERLAEARSTLGAQAVQVVVVMVSIDPLYDTPAVLAQYLAPFGPRFYGASGAPQETHDLAASYDLDYAARPDGSVAHTPLAFLIDRAGCWRAAYPPALSAEQIGSDLRLLLNEPLSASPCAAGLTP